MKAWDMIGGGMTWGLEKRMGHMEKNTRGQRKGPFCFVIDNRSA